MSKIIFSASGTAGHVKAALNLAEQLPHHSISFLASGLQNNPFFGQFPFEEVSAQALQMHKPFSSCWNISKGIYESILALRKKKPDLVVGFGSYHTFPVMIAAKILRIPRIVYEPNLLPGKVVRLSCRLGALALVRYKESKSFLKGKSVEIGWEKTQIASREEAINYLGLSSSFRTCLIFGGSQGAQFFNEKLPQMLQGIKEQIQILHFVGKHGSVKKIQEWYDNNQFRAVCKLYENRMDLAYAAADLCICRSGAGTLQELILTATPALLVPFSLASEDHQMKNAEFFVKQAEGGWVMRQEELTKEKMRSFFLDLNQENLLEKKEKLHAFYNKLKKEPTLKQVIESVLHAR